MEKAEAETEAEMVEAQVMEKAEADTEAEVVEAELMGKAETEVQTVEAEAMEKAEAETEVEVVEAEAIVKAEEESIETGGKPHAFLCARVLPCGALMCFRAVDSRASVRPTLLRPCGALIRLLTSPM